MIDYLRELCSVDGTSGRENDVRDCIISKIDGKCEYKVDAMGNLLVFKKGKASPKNKVMLTAHMDEVAFIITGYTSDGYLRFDSVGGINSKTVCGRTLRFTQNDQHLYGVVGVKPIHLCDGKEDVTVPSITDFVIDIGAADENEAKSKIAPGDIAYFVSDFDEFGKNKIRSKAIDDRFGCSLLIKMIDSDLPFDTYFTFLVQEEIGLRGAAAAAYTIDPDYAIVIEATTACDTPGNSGADKVCSLGNGAVISYMDRTTAYDSKLFKDAFKTAKEHDISVQTKTKTTGGNDAGVIHKSMGGIKTITVSLPCRYIHSASCVADKDDISSCFELVALLTEKYADA